MLSLLLSYNQVQNFPFPSPPEPSALKAAHACLEALSALNPGGCERCGDGCVPGVGVRGVWVVGVAGVWMVFRCIEEMKPLATPLPGYCPSSPSTLQR